MNKKIIAYVLLGILIVTLIFFTIFPNMTYAIRDFGKSSSGSQGDDICSPPSGVSQEDWNTHMGHHPEMYEGCLG